MSTELLKSSVSHMREEIDTLKDKLDMLTNDNSNLDEEISMAQTKLHTLQKQCQEREAQIRVLDNLEVLMAQEKKAQQDLADMEKKVEAYLTVVEDLETNGVLDRDATAKLLMQEKQKQEELLKSLRKELEEKMKELAGLEEEEA
jgi:chromosome segregation ATPase